MSLIERLQSVLCEKSVCCAGFWEERSTSHGRPACRCINEAAPNPAFIAEEAMQVIAFECLIECVCWVAAGRWRH